MFRHAPHPFILLLLYAARAAADAPDAVTDRFPNAESIAAAPVAGLYEIHQDYQVRYVAPDGRLAFLAGDITDLETGENLTESARREMRQALMAELDEWDTVDFAAEDGRHTILVFTDTDCGYCRRLHEQRGEYNALGINIRYAAFPRSGLDSATGSTMTAIWCADDRQDAMTRAKRGEILTPPTRPCSTPIAGHAGLARKLGLRGTPLLLTDAGELVDGYVPPEDLIGMLDPDAPQQGAGDAGE